MRGKGSFIGGTCLCSAFFGGKILRTAPSAARFLGLPVCGQYVPSFVFSAARLPGCLLAMRIYLSPSMRLHLSPSAARSRGRTRRAACSPVRTFTCFQVCDLMYLAVLPDAHLPVSQHVPSFVSQCAPSFVSAPPDRSARFPMCACTVSQRCHIASRTLASARIYLSHSMCLHFASSAARSPVRTFTCLPVCAFICFQALPDLGRVKCTHMCAAIADVFVFQVNTFVCSSRIHMCVPRVHTLEWHLFVFEVNTCVCVCVCATCTHMCVEIGHVCVFKVYTCVCLSRKYVCVPVEPTA